MFEIGVDPKDLSLAQHLIFAWANFNQKPYLIVEGQVE